MVLRAAVQLIARADRGAGRGGDRRAGTSAVNRKGLIDKLIVPAVVSPLVAFVVAGASILHHLPGRRGPASRGGGPRVPAGPARLRRPARALARHQRRPEDDGRHHAGADRQRKHPGRAASTSRTGSWSPRPARSRWAPSSVAGGSSRRVGTRIISMDPAQGFAAQTAGAVSSSPRRSVGYPALDDARDLGWDHRRRSGARASPPCAGASPATSSGRGCSRCPPWRARGAGRTSVTGLFGQWRDRAGGGGAGAARLAGGHHVARRVRLASPPW